MQGWIFLLEGFVTAINKHFDISITYFIPTCPFHTSINLTLDDYITNVIDHDYFPHARLRINKVAM